MKLMGWGVLGIAVVLVLALVLTNAYSGGSPPWKPETASQPSPGGESSAIAVPVPPTETPTSTSPPTPTSTPSPTQAPSSTPTSSPVPTPVPALSVPAIFALLDRGEITVEQAQRLLQGSNGDGPLPDLITTSAPAAALQTTPSQPTPTPLPSESGVATNQYMLSMINEARAKAGVPPVVLGDNTVAQLHADSALENCFSSHWGVDGLKPYMRYSLAGGYQSNSENVSGSSYCITAKEGYRAIGNIRQEIRDHMDGLVDSPGHYRNIVDPGHRKVNIGLAWDSYNAIIVQHFEGDYVEYDQPPTIIATPTSGRLIVSGRTKNGARFEEDLDLRVALYYDPPPQQLTSGQLARTYCYNIGRKDATFRPRLPKDWYYPTDEHTTTPSSSCADPYQIPADSPPATSPWDARFMWRSAQVQISPSPITVPWITAFDWEAENQVFYMAADIHLLLVKYGPGVYTIAVSGLIDGEEAIISEHSIFHDVEVPDNYGQILP